VSQYQPYDSALKSLMGDEVAEILPNLLPEAEYIGEQNIEIDRTTLKADLVYNILYKGQPCLLNMELQTDADGDMPIRMLKYHVGLYDKHRLPVISMVLYPFETSIPEPTFEEKSGDERLLTFYYRVVALWTLDARDYVRRRIICMYTFLPAMMGVSISVLLQAVKEMEQSYTRVQFTRHFTRFKTILHRSRTLSEQDKKEMEEQLYTYDSLLDQDPEIQERIAKAKAEGEIQGAQEIVVGLVEVRFPALGELAQERVTLIRNTEALSQLARQVATAPDEGTLRWLLNTFTT
jgi:hypothetical protein